MLLSWLTPIGKQAATLVPRAVQHRINRNNSTERWQRHESLFSAPPGPGIGARVDLLQLAKGSLGLGFHLFQQARKTASVTSLKLCNCILRRLFHFKNATSNLSSSIMDKCSFFVYELLIQMEILMNVIPRGQGLIVFYSGERFSFHYIICFYYLPSPFVFSVFFMSKNFSFFHPNFGTWFVGLSHRKQLFL